MISDVEIRCTRTFSRARISNIFRATPACERMPRPTTDTLDRSHSVASALGHESFKTTAAHYAKREAVAGAQQTRALAVLTGGRVAS